ncbi:magnesium/cobalt transporter CorA [Nocardioides marmotae]|uniref:magnesium/cobalt transporter CorA n=1 Tax=Nocardioides marmotae TaxID=2663857 RepID=UPI00132818CB|nr:magnesium/cobalt transporter CorA [Nocardioides marmotae]MBC9731613.1 magnesium/cobalt transporter CorA [Nocardioides marmotae]MTB82735.1 magnesium/cobalt transporter CorA [Nocardioides marmotae]
MIVDSALYRHGARVPVECEAHDYARLRAEVREEGDFVWLGLHEPDMDELSEVAAAFGLHPLAVEDAVNAHQRPKLERYADSLFLVLKTLWYVDADDAVETGEINMFIGPDFVVTVRHGRGADLRPARQHLEEHQRVLDHGLSAVVYAVCDSVVDAYREVALELEQDVDEVEESVFAPTRSDDSARIYTLKREIAEVRRAVLPLRDPMRRLAAGEVEGIAPEAGPFFRDVLDHLGQVDEVVDNLETMLSSAFDAQVSRISVQQNDDMRKISAGAALVVVPTLIAGIYGMNFSQMPELHWTFGYPFALSLMVGSSAVLWIFFKRSGWL